ncbi:hypothetical protein DCC85_03650 [Paenibacillus sp. CAA11]|uniref:hypothetical protein n=1 Tax=Paenibacillus sp. CAA11 TaxID=1532905 RepID=UPI000D35BE39|nr:hypothetical protein [Paenibacillus sp. CAA11]AWB43404.1 hypothetical protein DCC85_03650 [Paenibacillus sp. CAA11]
MNKIKLAALSAAALALAVQPLLLPQTQAAAAASATAVSTVSTSEVYRSFEALLKQPGKLAQAKTYLGQHISKATRREASLMTLHLENAQNKALETLENRLGAPSVQAELSKLYKQGDSLSTLIQRTQDASLKKLLTQAKQQGYRLETAEGMFFPMIDYAQYSPFSAYVTPDIKAYIGIMSVESTRVPLKDAAIVIGYQEIAARALSQESFIQKYPHSNRITQIKALFEQYRTLTFYGANNTPLFDYESGQITPNAKKGYLAFLQRNNPKGSPYLTQLASFMKLVADNQDQRTDAVNDYLKKNVPLD